MKAIITMLILLFTTMAEASQELKVMSFNILRRPEPLRLERIIGVIQTSGADIVGLQESEESNLAIAGALGFYIDQESQIVSRYPIEKKTGRRSVLIRLPNQKLAWVSNVHLQSFPYGPYELRKGTSRFRVGLNELTTHVFPMLRLSRQGRRWSKKGTFAFITGDFNVPSHLDWKKTHQGINDGHHYPWPLSKMLERRGFIDTYRKIYPDPLRQPGDTWSPGFPKFEKFPPFMSSPVKDEMFDRIDFVYHRPHPEAQLDSSDVWGPEHPEFKKTGWVWPSDHRAVLSTFKLR